MKFHENLPSGSRDIPSGQTYRIVAFAVLQTHLKICPTDRGYSVEDLIQLAQHRVICATGYGIFGFFSRPVG